VDILSADTFNDLLCLDIADMIHDDYCSK